MLALHTVTLDFNLGILYSPLISPGMFLECRNRSQPWVPLFRYYCYGHKTNKNVSMFWIAGGKKYFICRSQAWIEAAWQGASLRRCTEHSGCLLFLCQSLRGTANTACVLIFEWQVSLLRAKLPPWQPLPCSLLWVTLHWLTAIEISKIVCPTKPLYLLV